MPRQARNPVGAASSSYQRAVLLAFNGGVRFTSTRNRRILPTVFAYGADENLCPTKALVAGRYASVASSGKPVVEDIATPNRLLRSSVRTQRNASRASMRSMRGTRRSGRTKRGISRRSRSAWGPVKEVQTLDAVVRGYHSVVWASRLHSLHEQLGVSLRVVGQQDRLAFRATPAHPHVWQPDRLWEARRALRSRSRRIRPRPKTRAGAGCTRHVPFRTRL